MSFWQKVRSTFGFSEVDESGERRRLGDRVTIQQPAVLRIGERAMSGTIQDIGAGGIYFATPAIRTEVGQVGLIAREGGRHVPVRVAWVRLADGSIGPGLGLAFDSRLADSLS